MGEEVTADTLEGVSRWHWGCGWCTGLGWCHAVTVAAVLSGGVDGGCDARPENR